ncbi:YtxH domain-containing protein [Aerococcaceae bacterium INB8]|uniref:YtxH domain-containing protein n=1 Tax=Ruoffia halotolerans TaxID=2748684 RepID=A0A839A7S8_9LACT|nr:YtxH domain-containing protein [Ruoffia halotolerans]MBA5730127.1 YtxH domain-containing protein [Ruoffia halotolerans]
MSKNGGFFLGALFGASVAGIAALLYAPKSGKELRRDIAVEVDQFLDSAGEYTDYAVERGVELYDAAYETTEDIKVNLKDSADQFKSQFDDIRQEASTEWNRVKSDMKDSKDELSKDAQKLKEDAEDLADTISVEAKDLSDDVSDSAQHVKASTEDAVDNVKDEVNK